MLSRKALGKLVKEARQIKSEKVGKRYSQKMLADDINKSQSYIGDIETGRTYPSFAVLAEIAEACTVPISYFQDEKKINDDIDKFIKANLDVSDTKQLHEIRNLIKNDPDAKINYIYDYLIKNNLLNKNSNVRLSTPEDAVKFLLKQSAIIDFLKIDIDKLSDKKQSDFTSEILHQLKLISYKYKK